MLEAMKMEHEIAPRRRRRRPQRRGRGRRHGRRGAGARGPRPGSGRAQPCQRTQAPHPRRRDDLEAVRARHAQTLDEARPEAVAKRHEREHSRTARENLDDLVDPGSFVEYGPLMFAAQERRRTTGGADRRTPADGLVGGIGDDRWRCRRSSCPTTTPCSPARRGCATTRRRTGCSRSPSAAGCRSCCSPRAAAAGPATSICRSSPDSTAARSTCSHGSAGSSR